MQTVLVLAHTDADSALPRAAREVLTAALQVVEQLADARLLVGLIGSDVNAAADCIAGCGAEMIGVTGPAFADSRYASDVAAAAAIIEAAGATLVLAPATSRFSRAMPGVAARLDAAIDTGVCSVDVADGGVSIQRWYYRQRMIATLSRSGQPWLLTIGSGVYPAWDGAGGSAQVTALAVELPPDACRTRVIGVEAPEVDAQTIRPDADLLFVAGAGWTKQQADGAAHVDEAEALILSFLKDTQASLGTSKSVVDLQSEGQQAFGFVSHLNQVGQTGASPRHGKGLATCCHGEEPHVVGWRFVNDRRAVNLDANCGWAQGKADVLYVADAFAVVSRLNELLGTS
jgi:electron transfer flavoprotein alpha subunit